MKKLLFLFLCLAMCSSIALAQNGYVTTTGTVPSYAGGQVTAAFQNQSTASQLSLLNNSVFAQTAVGNLDANGKFSLSLADNLIIQPTPSQWQLIICAKPGNTGQPCYPVTITITCVGNSACVNGTLDVSASFAGAPAPPNPSTVNGLFPNVYFSKPTDTISSIETACAVACTYVVTTPQTITLAANHTLSSKISLVFQQSGLWTVNGSGFTLSIPQRVDGTLSQHFAGTGAVKFMNMQPLVPVEWFGAVGDATRAGVGTDSTAAIQAALNSLTTGQILLQQVQYKTTAPLTITAPAVGIRGTTRGTDIQFAVASQPNGSGIVNTTAAGDIVDVVGLNENQRIYYNNFNDFSLMRSVIPTGTAAGLSLSFVGGAVIDSVTSLDSVRDFYLHSTPSWGIGYIANSWGLYGTNGVTEPDGPTYTCFYVDSADGMAPDSLRMRHSACTSNLTHPPGAGPFVHGLDDIGSAINDVMVDEFETFGASTAIFVNYTGGGNAIANQDIHFKNVILDGGQGPQIIVQNISSPLRGSVEVTGGWVNSGDGAAAIEITNSYGVAIRNLQIEAPSAGQQILLSGCTECMVTGNQIIAGTGIGIQVTGTSLANVITGNTVLMNAASTGIQFDTSSSHNAVSSNILSGIMNFGITTDASSQFNVWLQDNTYETGVVTPFTDPSLTNAGQVPYVVTREVLGTGTPTVAVNSGAGAGATVALGTGSNDLTGFFTLTTGSGPSANAQLFTMTFSTAKHKSPLVFLYPGNAAAAGLSLFSNALSNSAYVISAGAAAPAASTAYVYQYWTTN